jgi:hypothetical protein
MKNTEAVATAVRMEFDQTNGDLYLVFKVIDESFKQRVRENWLQTIDLVMLGKDLIQKGG